MDYHAGKQGDTMGPTNGLQGVVYSPTADGGGIATNISVRGEYDAIMEIMGEHACRIIYRNAGLLPQFERPPEYNFDPCVPVAKCFELYGEVLDLVGLNGAIGIWRRIGYLSTKRAAEIGRVSDFIGKDLSHNEMYHKAVELYTAAIGTGRIVTKQDGGIDFERPECSICSGHRGKRPMCSLTEGCLQYLADHAYGKDIYRIRETKCKAMGDKTCYYVLEKVAQNL
jgi:predicted hydrocarbon binding protein